MDSYIKRAFNGDKYSLSAKFVALEDFNDLKNKFIGLSLIYLECPSAQNLSQVWNLILDFENGAVLKISALSTNVGEWEEMGSLRFSLTNKQKNLNDRRGHVYTSIPVKDFIISKICLLEFRNEKIISDCGVVFTSREGQKITVVTTDIPGALTVAILSSEGEISSYPKLNDCPLKDC